MVWLWLFATSPCFRDEGTTVNTFHVLYIERFSNECRKTKTKVITPANHNGHKLSNEPIRTRSKYILLASSAGKNVRARASRD